VALMTTTTTELAHQFQTVFNRQLLERAMQRVVLDQFATKSPFPKNAGAKTMRMFRLESGSAANVSTLTEGVPLTTYSEVGLDYVEATLVQYGQVYKISDVLGLTELFSTLLASKSRMAEESALHADQIVRNVLIAGATQKLYANGDADFNTLVADTTAGYLAIKDLLRAMTTLEINRAPRKDGEYFAIVPPQVAYDLMLDTQWFIPVNTYQDKTNVVKGEVGKWFNVRVVIATVPFREANTNGTEGTFASTGPIYSTIVTGADAYGTPIMAGNSPYSPHIYINDKADKADPLNQTVLAGWKSYWAALVLNANWYVVIRSKTSFA
jgi:N4-gp56 family major capsid protein